MKQRIDIVFGQENVGRPGALLFATLVLTAVLAAGSTRAAGPGVYIGGTEAASGSVVLLPVSYEAPESSGPATLVVRVTLPSAQVEVLDLAPGDGLAEGDKRLDYKQGDQELTISIFGGREALASGTLCRLLMRVRPDVAGPATITLADAGTHGADKDAEQVPVSLDAGRISVVAGMSPHNADSDNDWRISLQELLRLIQFYNVGVYHCDDASADGFAPGPGPADCPPHDADYNPEDWSISFVELLRMIQFYNAPYGVYHVRPDTEDGFAPGPFGIVYTTP